MNVYINIYIYIYLYIDHLLSFDMIITISIILTIILYHDILQAEVRGWIVVSDGHKVRKKETSEHPPLLTAKLLQYSKGVAMSAPWIGKNTSSTLYV